MAVPLMSDEELGVYRDYLANKGAQILPAKDGWELVRYKFDGSEIEYALYRTSTSNIVSDNAAGCHYVDYLRDIKPLPHRRPIMVHKRIVVAQLLARDGKGCCYCDEPLGTDVTLEHFLSLAHGGNNTLENMALAHSHCNMAASNLAVVQKLRLREILMAVCREDRDAAKKAAG